MNNSKTSTTNTKLIQSLFLFAMFLIFSFSGFAQSESNATVSVERVETVNVKLESSKSTSNMEFALWFMATKQDPNSTISTEGTNTKKMIMTSGMAPNRLLIKAFLKKVVNHESALS